MHYPLSVLSQYSPNVNIRFQQPNPICLPHKFYSAGGRKGVASQPNISSTNKSCNAKLEHWLHPLVLVTWHWLWLVDGVGRGNFWVRRWWNEEGRGQVLQSLHIEKSYSSYLSLVLHQQNKWCKTEAKTNGTKTDGARPKQTIAKVEVFSRTGGQNFTSPEKTLGAERTH